MSLSFKIILNLILSWLLFFSPTNAWAENGTAKFDLLKEQYLRLRNTDANVSKVSDWFKIAEQLEDFARLGNAGSNAPAALIDASIAFEKIYQRLGKTVLIEHSVSLLNLVALRYSSDALADDALLRKGDLILKQIEKYLIYLLIIFL